MNCCCFVSKTRPTTKKKSPKLWRDETENWLFWINLCGNCVPEPIHISLCMKYLLPISEWICLLSLLWHFNRCWFQVLFILFSQPLACSLFLLFDYLILTKNFMFCYCCCWFDSKSLIFKTYTMATTRFNAWKQRTRTMRVYVKIYSRYS